MQASAYYIALCAPTCPVGNAKLFGVGACTVVITLASSCPELLRKSGTVRNPFRVRDLPEPGVLQSRRQCHLRAFPLRQKLLFPAYNMFLRRGPSLPVQPPHSEGETQQDYCCPLQMAEARETPRGLTILDSRPSCASGVARRAP
ncbi:unnamed protein product [Ectocarpus sp. 12 AP-2014]